jgi:hypothetical protein
MPTVICGRGVLPSPQFSHFTLAPPRRLRLDDGILS